MIGRRAAIQWRMDALVCSVASTSSCTDSWLQVPTQTFASLEQTIVSLYSGLVYDGAHPQKKWNALIKHYTPFQWEEFFSGGLHCLLEAKLLHRSSRGLHELEVQLYVRHNDRQWERIHKRDVRASDIRDMLAVRAWMPWRRYHILTLPSKGTPRL